MPEKWREIREIMADMDMEICSMKEAGISLDIEENGTTFEENAQIKAKAVMPVRRILCWPMIPVWRWII